MFGRLTLGAFVHDPITEITIIATILLGLVGVILLFKFKLIGWLWKNWFTSLDPKKIGVMYLCVAALMLLRGLADSLLIRTQQATSVGASHGIVNADTFQQIFSSHGTMMIFFVAMGALFGIINMILPMQVGSRDVAFPLLNSISFWLFFGGVALINMSIIVGSFSNAGWLAYPPLSELAFNPGVGVDYWIWSLEIAGIGSLLTGINFIVTILKMRAPGMTLMKMPIFAWSVLCSMSLVTFAFPILTATLSMLALDRTLGMHFFTAGSGGDAMMYINLIWAWGHPEVYILILPAFGVFSEIVPVFSGKRLFGYKSMVVALVAITILSFTVWLHHFFTMGAGADVNAFFGIMTMIISIPTGVKVFNWLFTMYRGRIRLTTPMMWFLGFIVTFTIGGVAGVLMAVPAIDFEVHNSLFLVAHFHTMIIGGVVFGIFAGFTYWFPKFTGFTLNERLGRYAFWLWITGFCLAFIPLYILGLLGATRRLDHYVNAGWQGFFVIAAIGAVIICAGVGMQMLQIVVSIIQRKQNLVIDGDPWNGRTLEWSTVAPPPEYNYAIIPQVTERDEFWVMKKKGLLKKTDIVYEAIDVPKNSSFGIFIAIFASLFAFAVVWHIVWLVIVALIITILIIIFMLTRDREDETISAKEVEERELAAEENRVYA
jgi:cytochrome o ubiquinol oxidase subunit 1